MAQKTFVSGDVLTAADTNLYLMHEGGAWTSWTPTWTSLSVGNGTVSALYARASRLITWKLKLTFGSTTTVSGGIRFTLPAAASTGVEFDNAFGTFVDASSSRHLAMSQFISTTTIQVNGMTVTGTSVVSGSDIVSGSGVIQIATTASVPFTWTTSDQIIFSGVYESLA